MMPEEIVQCQGNQSSMSLQGGYFRLRSESESFRFSVCRFEILFRVEIVSYEDGVKIVQIGEKVLSFFEQGIVVDSFSGFGLIPLRWLDGPARRGLPPLTSIPFPGG
jgi:hypothetical protein